MTENEEKMLMWVHHHKGKATKEQLGRHYPNTPADERELLFTALVAGNYLERARSLSRRGPPAQIFRLTGKGKRYLRKQAERGRLVLCDA